MAELEKKQKEVGLNKEDNGSSDFSKKTKKGLFSILTNQADKELDPEKYFQEVLEEGEFEQLKILVQDSGEQISWKELVKKGVVKIENSNVEGIYWEGDLNLSNSEIKTLWKVKKIEGSLDCKGAKSLGDLGELEEVGGDLDITETGVKSLGKLEEVGGDLTIKETGVKSLGKLKKVGRFLNCEGVGSLEDLGELEEVGGDLTIAGTGVKSLGKLKKVGNNIYCKGVESLEDLGELEEVGLFLNIIGTNIRTLGKLEKVGRYMFCIGLETLEDLGNLKEVGKDLYILVLQVDMQIKINKMIEKGELEVEGETIFGGNIEGVGKLLEQERINGNLDLSDAPISIQIRALYKIKITKELQVENRTMANGIEEMFRELYSSEDGKLNIKFFQEKFGRDIKEIEDEETRKGAVKILELEYKRITKELNEKIEEIKKETDVEGVLEKEKIKLREQIADLISQFKEAKSKLENLGIEFD